MKKLILISTIISFLITSFANAIPEITIHSPQDNQTYHDGVTLVNITLSERANLTLEIIGTKASAYNITIENTTSYENYFYGEDNLTLRVYSKNENGSDFEEVSFELINGGYSIYVSSCGVLSTPETYYLTQDIY